MERRAEPVHSVVNSIFDGLMPILFREGIFVIDDIADRVAVLETSELAFAVTDSEDEIACTFGGFHSGD